ncbi:DUF6254 family protein [Cohnella herbarum]|uniref:Uncharacterized protein n=1 Tax=Cohnella herbarum TaxID=2728023 RepID=A0A7Z2VGD3_9BACL|nr:DUF6254 family protein [Cohnella herbarum]QJD82584.1 hypothetical protein HH215_04840 [Cohnella herbarum]
MPTSKRRRESTWKSRKQNQQPHGKITSLHELANETNPEGKTDPTS